VLRRKVGPQRNEVTGVVEFLGKELCKLYFSVHVTRTMKLRIKCVTYNGEVHTIFLSEKQEYKYRTCSVA
jgi:hypothetical protein